MIKTVIIDDQENSRNAIKNLLLKYCPDIELMGEADGVKNGLDLIAKKQPQLVFLDVQMIDGTGFSLLEQIKEYSFKVIFTTAFDRYAVQAIRFSALDYLLKPVDPDELINAVARYKEPGINLNIKLNFDVLLENVKKTNAPSKKIVLSTVDKVHILKVEDVIRCESLENYTQFSIINDARIVMAKTLKEYEELLTEYFFMRVHKSHLVNLNHVVNFIKGDGGYLTMSDGKQVPVSDRKKDELFERLQKL